MYHSETQDGYPISVPTSFHGYKILNYLGRGSTCVVVLVEDEITHELYSAKIMSKTDLKNRNMTKSIKKEINVLKMVDHPNIIKIHETLEIHDQDDEYVVIITEYCPNGDLLSYAIQNRFKSEYQRKTIIYGFLDAIKYLHDKKISHGDIKSENILLDINFSPKLCDFGFCRTEPIAGDDSKNGTLYYAAPELFVKGRFDPQKSDIWAIGITLYSLFDLKFPFKDGKQSYIIKQIMNGNLSINRRLNSQILQIFNGCVKQDPKMRMSIDDILNSDYFSELNADKEKSKYNNTAPTRKLPPLVKRDGISISSSLDEQESYEFLFRF